VVAVTLIAAERAVAARAREAPERVGAKARPTAGVAATARPTAVVETGTRC